MMFYNRHAKKSFLSLDQRYKIVSLIFLANIASQFSVDLYTPSFPAMMHFFDTTRSSIQLSLSLYLFGYGGCQLLFGYLADRLGQRPALLIAYLGFLLSTIGIIFSHNIEELICWRFVQGASAACFQMSLRSGYRALFSGNELTKVSAIYSTVWGVLPIIAPAIGSYIQHYFDWRMGFKIIMVLTAFFFILTYKLLPELRTPKETKEGHNFFSAIKQCLTNKSLIVFAFIVGLGAANVMLFINSAPFLLQVNFSLSVITYGWLVLVVSAFNLLASLLVSFIAKRAGNRILLVISSTGLLISSLLMLVFYSIGLRSLLFVLIPMCFIYFWYGMIFPAAAGKAYQTIKDNVGVATAIFGTILILISAVFLTIFSHIPHATVLPLACSLVLINTTICLLLFWNRQRL